MPRFIYHAQPSPAQPQCFQWRRKLVTGKHRQSWGPSRTMKCSSLQVQALLRLRRTGISLSSSSPSLSSVKRLSFLVSFPPQTRSPQNPCSSPSLRFPLKPNSSVLSYSSSFVVTLRFESTTSSSCSKEDVEFEANEEEDLFQCKPLFFYFWVRKFLKLLSFISFSFGFVFLR